MENLQNFKFPDFSEFSVPKEVIYPLLLKASSLHFWNFIWPHFTLITTLKAFSPNIVTFSDGGRGKDFNTGINWEGEEGHKSAHNHEWPYKDKHLLSLLFYLHLLYKK